MSTSAVIGKAVIGQATVGTEKEVASNELFVPDAPGYPEGLHPYPENYTIYLPKDKYNPVEKIAAQAMGKTWTNTKV